MTGSGWPCQRERRPSCWSVSRSWRERRFEPSDCWKTSGPRMPWPPAGTRCSRRSHSYVGRLAIRGWSSAAPTATASRSRRARSMCWRSRASPMKSRPFAWPTTRPTRARACAAASVVVSRRGLVRSERRRVARAPSSAAGRIASPPRRRTARSPHGARRGGRSHRRTRGARRRASDARRLVRAPDDGALPRWSPGGRPRGVSNGARHSPRSWGSIPARSCNDSNNWCCSRIRHSMLPPARRTDHRDTVGRKSAGPLVIDGRPRSRPRRDREHGRAAAVRDRGRPGRRREDPTRDRGRARRSSFADGAWFVRLDSARNAASVIEAVADALHANGASESSLVERLRGADVLVVLDNCEQVVEAAADVVATLLSAGPGVRVLATSQLPFGSDGETVYPLRPLMPADSVALFASARRRSRRDVRGRRRRGHDAGAGMSIARRPPARDRTRRRAHEVAVDAGDPPPAR